MIPDERLREAVGAYLDAMERDDPGHCKYEALENLRSVYNEDPRPCINAAVEVGGFWSAFWRGWRSAHDSRFYWWGVGLTLGFGLGGFLR